MIESLENLAKSSPPIEVDEYHKEHTGKVEPEKQYSFSERYRLNKSDIIKAIDEYIRNHSENDLKDYTILKPAISQTEIVVEYEWYPKDKE